MVRARQRGAEVYCDATTQQLAKHKVRTGTVSPLVAPLQAMTGCRAAPHGSQPAPPSVKPLGSPLLPSRGEGALPAAGGGQGQGSADAGGHFRGHLAACRGNRPAVCAVPAGPTAAAASAAGCQSRSCCGRCRACAPGQRGVARGWKHAGWRGCRRWRAAAGRPGAVTGAFRGRSSDTPAAAAAAAARGGSRRARQQWPAADKRPGSVHCLHLCRSHPACKPHAHDW